MEDVKEIGKPCELKSKLENIDTEVKKLNNFIRNEYCNIFWLREWITRYNDIMLVGFKKYLKNKYHDSSLIKCIYYQRLIWSTLEKKHYKEQMFDFKHNETQKFIQETYKILNNEINEHNFKKLFLQTWDIKHLEEYFNIISKNENFDDKIWIFFRNIVRIELVNITKKPVDLDNLTQKERELIKQIPKNSTLFIAVDFYKKYNLEQNTKIDTENNYQENKKSWKQKKWFDIFNK